MLILLPPSEGKAAPARGKPMDVAALSFPELATLRVRVADALAETSRRDDAAQVLGVGAAVAGDIARNLRLTDGPAAPASRIYTGVLYDALGLATMTAPAKRRAARWLVTVSALYGAVRPGDRIASYRLSMDTDLPGVGPLARAWRSELSGVLAAAAGRGLVVDCRSSTYVAAASPSTVVAASHLASGVLDRPAAGRVGTRAARSLADRWVEVRVPGASHWAKHTRGLVARAICEHGLDVGTPRALAEALSGDFEVSLHRPARAGQHWVLDVHGESS